MSGLPSDISGWIDILYIQISHYCERSSEKLKVKLYKDILKEMGFAVIWRGDLGILH